MDAKVALTKLSPGRALVGLSASLLLLVVGCDKNDAQAKGDADETAASAAPAEAKAEPNTEQKPVPEAKSSYEEAAFKVRLQAPDSVEAGKESSFSVILEAKSGYKVNDEYPIKFQFVEIEHVVPKEKTVRDAKLEKKRAEIPLSVTIESKGKHDVAGKLSFSVCTDERCLIEKRDLKVSVDAS